MILIYCIEWRVKSISQIMTWPRSAKLRQVYSVTRNFRDFFYKTVQGFRLSHVAVLNLFKNLTLVQNAKIVHCVVETYGTEGLIN